MRFLLSALAGFTMAVLLFLIMSGMISGDSRVTRQSSEALNLDFVRLNLDEVENIRRRAPPPEPRQAEELERPPRLEAMPRRTELQPVPRIETAPFAMNTVNFSVGLRQGRFTGTMPLGEFDDEGDLYPLLRVSPSYPAAARLKRVFGWVDLEYTVLPDGSVVDISVVDSEASQTRVTNDLDRVPQDTFVEAAVAAIARWKFKPRVVNGQAVPTRVTQRINFDIIGGLE